MASQKPQWFHCCHSDLFENAENVKSILDYSFNQETDCEGSPPTPPNGLSPYLKSLYKYRTLSAKSERALFLKMNCAKFLAAKTEPIDRAMSQIALSTREILITHNLRLVVYVTKSIATVTPLDDLISCGNAALLRAVDKFDVNRTNYQGTTSKFSTYAAYAIKNAMIDEIKAANTVDDCIADFIDKLAVGRLVPTKNDIKDECIHNILSVLHDDLLINDRDRLLIIKKFGLDGDEPHDTDGLSKLFGIPQSVVQNITYKCCCIIRDVLGVKKSRVNRAGQSNARYR